MNVQTLVIHKATFSRLSTDASGAVNQHLQYLPFGEDSIYQRNSSWNIPYTFSGKEKDKETGYSYFGARYYDSDLSVCLSVDPMADKYPSMSAYIPIAIGTAGNPVMLVDPDGLAFTDREERKKAKYIRKADRIRTKNDFSHGTSFEDVVKFFNK